MEWILQGNKFLSTRECGCGGCWPKIYSLGGSRWTPHKRSSRDERKRAEEQDVNYGRHEEKEKKKKSLIKRQI